MKRSWAALRQFQNISRTRHRAYAMSLGAAGAFGGLVFLDGPLYAKTREARHEVYFWGSRDSMPGGASNDVLRPRKVDWFDTGSKTGGWKKIAFGPCFGAALDEAGNLYVWGSFAQKSDTDSDARRFVGPLPARTAGEASRQHFLDVQCSENQIYTLTSNGQVYVFDDMASVLESSKSETESLGLPGKKVRGLPGPGLFKRSGVTAMGIGPKHAAFVTHNGELYCFGSNKYGQCGVAPPVRKRDPRGAYVEPADVLQETPVKVDFPEEAGKIVSVSVGGKHTSAMDAAGKCFSFGDDTKIQLGLGDTRTGGYDERHAFGTYAIAQTGSSVKADIQKAVSYRFYDQHMQSSPIQTLHPPAYNRPPYPNASFVSCGGEFSVAVHRDSPDWYSVEDETNVLFACGENREGQCGRNLQQQQQTWNTVRLPKRCRTMGLTCGSGHCLAMLKTGELYGWGSNSKGQVGIGGRHLTKFGAPQKIEVWGKADEGEPEIPKGKIRNISCGFQSSAAICDPVDLVQQAAPAL